MSKEEEKQQSGPLDKLIGFLLLLGVGSAGYSYSRDFRNAVDFVIAGVAILALLVAFGWIGQVLGFIDSGRKGKG